MNKLREELIEINIILSESHKLNPRFKYILFKKPEYLQYIVEKTCFLKYDASIKTRIQCIVQNIDTQPYCAYCNSPCKMSMDGGRYHNKFPKYCSRSCAGKASSVGSGFSEHTETSS